MNILKVLLLVGFVFCSSVTCSTAQVSGSQISNSLREAVITEMKGDVQIRRFGANDWLSAEKGITLQEKDSIRTGKDSKAELTLSGKGSPSGTVHVSENSEMSLDKLMIDQEGWEQTLLDVRVGKILIRARTLEGDSQFEVKTPTSIAGVRGTEFEVIVDKAEA
ncbi:MAG: FecR domain-containing protein [Candidatus Omnitrophica bacterium]|nr:FecR domain-containing protein [Candidatus Omnitrophota bacterium]